LKKYDPDQVYPKFLFECECQWWDAGKVISSWYNFEKKKMLSRPTCPNHVGVKSILKIYQCQNEVCNKEYEAHVMGNNTKFCTDCRKLIQARRYKDWHLRHPRKTSSCCSVDHPDIILDPVVLPDMLLFEVDKNPCMQGCSYANKDKNNSVCTKCELRDNYFKRTHENKFYSIDREDFSNQY